MFPFYINGIVRFRKYYNFKNYDKEYLKNLLFDSLKNQVPMSIQNKNNSITFNRFIFNTLNNWNILFLVDHGDFIFSENNNDIIISYKISTAQAALCQFIFIIFVLLANIFPERPYINSDNTGIYIYYTIPFFISVYIINCQITKVRFKRWLRELSP